MNRLPNDQRIGAVIERQFPNNKMGGPHFCQLLTEYAESGIGPPHLVDELETDENDKLWSCIWEAMLYRHLRAHGYEPKGTARHTGQYGPDFPDRARLTNHLDPRLWYQDRREFQPTISASRRR